MLGTKRKIANQVQIEGYTCSQVKEPIYLVVYRRLCQINLSPGNIGDSFVHYFAILSGI